MRQYRSGMGDRWAPVIHSDARDSLSYMHGYDPDTVRASIQESHDYVNNSDNAFLSKTQFLREQGRRV